MKNKFYLLLLTKANKHQIKEAFVAIFGQKPEKISTVLRKPVVVNKHRPN